MQASASSAFVVLRGSDPLPPTLARPVLAIGNFDGVHRGHRAVFETAKSMAAAAEVSALALTFEPHPRTFFSPKTAPFRLTPEPLKLKRIAENGLAGAIVLDFDVALATMEAEDFVRNILVGRYQVTGVVVGFDFHFGRARAGSPSFLKDAGARYGFQVKVVEPLLDEDDPISSSAIRRALAAGQVGHAAHMLGRPFTVTAPVQHGDARGRTIGFPTANMTLDHEVDLAYGIYAVRVTTSKGHFNGVANFGRRPTFDNGAPLLEVNIFDFSDDIYGERITVELVAYLRPELKFDSVDALVTQIREDARRAREVLAKS